MKSEEQVIFKTKRQRQRNASYGKTTRLIHGSKSCFITVFELCQNFHVNVLVDVVLFRRGGIEFFYALSNIRFWGGILGAFCGREVAVSAIFFLSFLMRFIVFLRSVIRWGCCVRQMCLNLFSAVSLTRGIPSRPIFSVVAIFFQ